MLVAALAALAGQAWAAASLTVGSKNFTENRLLAEIMAQLIEARTDIEVERRTNLGGTKVVFEALQGGAIDIYPEYTGTGWAIHLGRDEPVRDPLRAYAVVGAAFRQDFDAEWLIPFGFSNSYALAMRTERAQELGIKTLTDLREHQDELVVGVSHEFLNRPDGYPGLARAYDLAFADLKGMEHGLAYEALASGEIDVVDTWTTDGKLLRYPIELLEDDQRFFPPYDAAPVVRLAALARHPRVRDILGELGFRIDDATMRRLNHDVEKGGGSFRAVARRFLDEEGLTAQATGAARVPPAGKRKPVDWARLGALAVEHMILTGVAVLLAIVIAVPLGIAIAPRRTVAGPVLAAAGILQTIPSLALLAFLIPLPGFGLGARSAIAALFLYALLPIVRNTVTAIHEVAPSLIEAARGLGLTDRQILRHVKLPLAVRTIMAGIRTATVISIGIATLAAFIGAGGLGDPIVTGLQLNDTRLILSGAIPAALLAIVVDFLLGRLERALTPAGAA